MSGPNVPFAAILASVAEGIIAVDPAFQIQLMNPAASRLLQITTLVRTGTPLFEVVRHAELADLLQRTLSSGQPSANELTIFIPRERIFRASAVRYDHPDGHGALVVLSDITDVRKLEHLRRDFVANVSHELRTPVTAIQAAVDTLKGGAAEQADNRERFLSKIHAQAQRLARLIDELMTLSQTESGGLTFALEAVPIEPIVREAMSVLEPRAQAQQIAMHAERLSNAPPVCADRERLYQVILNVLDNAIKFNRDAGQVMIRHCVENNHLVLSVTDTGIGIPAEELPRVFERFYRVEKTRARSQGGSGLGLAIVRHLMEAQGGRVQATSQLGHGSTFSITLPLSTT